MAEQAVADAMKKLMRAHVQSVTDILREIESRGGPATPEEWAYYATHHTLSADEFISYEDAGSDFLTECFRQAIASRDQEFRRAIDEAVKQHGRRGVARTAEEAGANKVGMELLGFFDDPQD